MIQRLAAAAAATLLALNLAGCIIPPPHGHGGDRQQDGYDRRGGPQGDDQRGPGSDGPGGNGPGAQWR